MEGGGSCLRNPVILSNDFIKNTGPLGNYLSSHLVSDRRVGGPGVCRREQSCSRDSGCTGADADSRLASCLRGDSARSRISLRQFPRGLKAVASADDCGYRVDHLCLWFQFFRAALAILAGPILGLVSTVRAPGLHQPSRSNHRRKRLEKRGPSRFPLCLRSPSKSFALSTYICRRRDLGCGLSTTTKSLRACALACSRFDHCRRLSAASMDKQPSRRF